MALGLLEYSNTYWIELLATWLGEIGFLWKTRLHLAFMIIQAPVAIKALMKCLSPLEAQLCQDL